MVSRKKPPSNTAVRQRKADGRSTIDIMTAVILAVAYAAHGDWRFVVVVIGIWLLLKLLEPRLLRRAAHTT